MVVRFTDENFDIKSVAKTEDSGYNVFLIENSKKQLEKIFDFYNSESPLLLVSGFMGTGKTHVVDYSLSFLDKKVITLKYNCFETTILDDIMLSFFEDFKELIEREIIPQPKIKSENFAQKITAYFNSINLPIVIVINSFESVLKNNKSDILEFIFHLAKNPNIKIVLISRVFNYEDFTDKIQFERVTVQALEKGIFEKYLRSVGIKNIGPVSDELYKHSRGYFLYTELTARIINAHKLSLIKFIEGYTKSFLSYNDFILREALAFVEPASGHLFRLLTILRHPISINLLKTVNLYNEERINFFTENLLLCREKDMIYLPDYYKEISQNSIPENVSVKLHKACMDLYTTQLPLKPFERDILISRQTMRTEIEYHSMFLPKKIQYVKPMDTMQVEAIGYAADSNADYSSIPKVDGTPVPADITVETAETKEDKLKKISFIFDTETEEVQIMDGIANSINNFIDYSNKVLTPEETKLPFMELINSANREEKAFNFKKALAFYQLALTMKEEDNFALMVSRLYTKTAKCYENLSDWFNALKYYDMALEYFVNAGDCEKLNEMRYAIANVFYNTYKHDKAERLLQNILEEKEMVSNDLRIKAHLLLATVKSNDIKEVYKNYKEAFALVEPACAKNIVSELYYKFAVVCDDMDETETAIKLYKRCTDITAQNVYLTSALLNLAIIFEETGAEDLSVKYYKECLSNYGKTENLIDIYEAAIRLAKINRRKNPEEALVYFRKALAIAKEINEPYYIISSNIEYGDFFADNKDFNRALKAYILAHSKIKDKTSENLKLKIEERLRDLKFRLGEEVFRQMENEIIHNG